MLFSSLLQIRSSRLSCFSTATFISIVVLTFILTFTTKAYSAQVTLAWDANTESDLAGYKVYYGDSSANYSSNVDVANQTSYTISNLVDGNTYFIVATAYDINGNESSYSNEVSYEVPIIDTTPPSNPINVQATAISSNQIDISWDASTDNVGIAGYKIYRDEIQIASSTNTSYQDTGLSSSTTYTYNVSAYDAAGNESTQSLSASATTLVVDNDGDGILDSWEIDNFGDLTTANDTTDYDNDGLLDKDEYINNTDPKNTDSDGDGMADGWEVANGLDPLVDDSAGDIDGDGITNLQEYSNYISINGTQFVINNLTVASGKAYEIVENGLQNGAIVYIDRGYTYSNVLTSLQGATYLKTANDDKASSSASFLTFDVNQDVIVYVAHDDRITTKPSWLANFTDTGDDLVTTDTTLSLFASYYLAGTITLGGNEGKGKKSMYTVVIVKQITDVITDTSAPVGSISINSGDASTNSTSVTLNLSATDDVVVTGFYVSVGSSAPSASSPDWQSVLPTTNYSADVSYTLSGGEGDKTVYVWYKDAADNVSVAYNDTITLVISESLISNLTVASGKAYQIVDTGLQNGARAYIDRKSRYNNLPIWLEGSIYIKTANSDNESNAASFLTFDANKDVTVYVAHDDRITTKPSWLTSFKDTGDDIVISRKRFSVYESNYLAGTIMLGGNKGSKKTNMYTVIIVGQ